MEGEGDWGERSEIGSETTIDVAGILQSTRPKEVASEALKKIGVAIKPLNNWMDKLSKFRFVKMVNFSFPNRSALAGLENRLAY